MALPTFSMVIDRIRLSTTDMDRPQEFIGDLRQSDHRTVGDKPISRNHWLYKPTRTERLIIWQSIYCDLVDANAVIDAGELFRQNKTIRNSKLGLNLHSKLHRTDSPRRNLLERAMNPAQAWSTVSCQSA